MNNKFVANVPDPNGTLEFLRAVVLPAEGISQDDAIHSHKRICSMFQLGPPRATPDKSQKSWEGAGFVGLYEAKGRKLPG